jgi:predicted transcriptional regulator
LNNLTARVDQLAEAQRRTEERLNELTERVNQLAEAQRRTEERLNELTERLNNLTARVDQLAEAQRKTEERLNEFERRTEENFARVWEAINRLTEAQAKMEERLNELTERVNQLAEAQRRTEERLNELTERLNNLTARVDQLAEAQRKTEERLNELTERVNQLAKEHQRTREILAGLSDTVGYGLEDKIMLYMYDFARDEFGVEVEVIERRNIVYPDGRYDEVNIYVEGFRNGAKVYIVGECKSRPSKREVDKLIEKVERVREFLGGEVYAFIVGYTFAPDVEEYIKEMYPWLKMMRSFEFDLRYGRKV